jgi:hypothetical protein
LRLTGSVRGRGGPHRAACIGGHWNPPYSARFSVGVASVRWRSGYRSPAARVSSARARARLGGTIGATQVGHPVKPRGLMLRGRCRCGCAVPASGPSSAVADAISCRSSRTEGSSDLRAGRRQPLIDRSPSRIGTTWRQVADQFTPRGQVSRAAFAIRDTDRCNITFHPCLLVIGVQHGAGRGGSFTLRATARSKRA